MLAAQQETCKSRLFSTGRGGMSPSPLRPSLVWLNLERGIRLPEVLLWISQVSGSATILALFQVRHFAQAFANFLDVFGFDLDHGSSRGGNGTPK